MFSHNAGFKSGRLHKQLSGRRVMNITHHLHQVLITLFSTFLDILTSLSSSTFHSSPPTFFWVEYGKRYVLGFHSFQTLLQIIRRPQTMVWSRFLYSWARMVELHICRTLGQNFHLGWDIRVVEGVRWGSHGDPLSCRFQAFVFLVVG